MRDFSPSVVNGLFFERLSFGLVPMSIMGVRIAPPQTSSGSNVAIGAPAAPENTEHTEVCIFSSQPALAVHGPWSRCLSLR